MLRTGSIKCALILIVAAASMGSLGASAAVVIPITNGSFEFPDVLNLTGGHPTGQNALGGTQNNTTGLVYTQQTATSSSAHYYGPNTINDAIPYWSVSMNTINSNAGMVYGISDPIGGTYNGTAGGTAGGFTGLSTNTDYTFNTLAGQSAGSTRGYANADGYQMAYANLAGSGGSVTLVYNPSDPNAGGGAGLSLGAFLPGDTYQVTAGIGTALNQGQYSYSLQFEESFDAGGTWAPVGTAATGNSPAANSGIWEQAAASFLASPTDNGLIGVVVTVSDPSGAAAQANIDNVQINDFPANGPPIPEPASLGVIGLGVLALRRRR